MDIETILTLGLAAGILGLALVIGLVAKGLGRLSSALFGWPPRREKAAPSLEATEPRPPGRARTALRRLSAQAGTALRSGAAAAATAIRERTVRPPTSGKATAAIQAPSPTRASAPRRPVRTGASRAPAPAPDLRRATQGALQTTTTALKEVGTSFADWFRESPPPRRPGGSTRPHASTRR